MVASGSFSGSVRRGEEAAKPLPFHAQQRADRERGGQLRLNRAERGEGSGGRKRDRGEGREGNGEEKRSGDGRWCWSVVAVAVASSEKWELLSHHF